MPHLEIIEVGLVHWDIVNNYYQQDSRVLYKFVPNKPFDSLLEIYPTNHIFLKTFNSDYDEIKVWFTDQISQTLETEERINLTMLIKWKIWKWDIQLNREMGKSLSNKYGQKLLDSAKKSTTDAIKTASKRAIQKTAEGTDDLIGNKIADKITTVPKKSTKELHNND